jgi:ubiquinone/menaquinone biosynthesis C-methylase UbiE
MVDIEIYESANDYEKFQVLRPDYNSAIIKSIELARKYIPPKGNVVVSDFCCGTGMNSNKYASDSKIKKVNLIDINSKFLEVARDSQINSDKVNIFNKNILDYCPSKESKIVCSIFAYHHLPDNQKVLFLKKIKESLANRGILIFTEIFFSSKELELEYYTKLIDEIPKDVMSKDLELFLRQTSTSSDFEFKVSKEFADNQLLESGFTLLEELKIWPTDKTFDRSIGTFVQIYRLDEVV